MFDLTQPYHGGGGLPAPVVTEIAYNITLYEFFDGAGNLLGEIKVVREGDTTKYNYFDSSHTLLGYVSEKIQGDTVDIRVMDASGTQTSRERTITRDDYTQVEYWDASGFSHAVKNIHTATQTGVQNYDSAWNLTSAYLETDDGNGRTQTADYGAGWHVIHRETITVSGNVTTTVVEENGAGNITGGSVVTKKPDFTLVETYGQDWVLSGAVKTIHTSTQTGEQIYDGDYNLISAHLESDDGNGRTQVADYGPGWHVIFRKTVTVTEDRTVTEIEENGAGNITGGSIVTEKPDFTLVETFGAGWTSLGSVKTIHSPTQTGVQSYDGSGNLISAHLETDDGKGKTQVADYGPGWHVIYRKTVTETADRVMTVIEENGAGNITGGTIVTEKADFTLVETFGAGWTPLGSVKTIHSPTQTGVQTYDGAGNLISAHLETDDGKGKTQVADYGPGWHVIYRKTVTETADRVMTVIEENGAGNITGGTIVTEKADFTLVETFGAGWTPLGSVKTIHTATTTGEQVYDADGNLVSAHLVIDDGNGRVQTAHYGPDWHVIYRETVTVRGDVTTTRIEENGAGNVTGGSVVTEKPDFTLIETYGQDWILAGAVKKIHTSSTTGQQVYDGDYKLVSASLIIAEGNRVVTEEYGPGWDLISRHRVTTTTDKVVTELMEGSDATLMWRTIYYGEDAKDENRFEVFNGEAEFHGTSVRDLMFGDDGNDSFFGYAGNDELDGGQGDDWLDGGDDDDEIVGGKGEDTIFAGDGDDFVRGGNDDDLIYGGAGDDEIDGSRGHDLIHGGSGEDDIKGSAGDDTIYGGDEDDVLSGGGQHDKIYGGAGNDDLFGNAGDDTLDGGKGADRLYGSNGKDVLIADGEGDTLKGGDGADTFIFEYKAEDAGAHHTVKDYGDGADEIVWRALAGDTAANFNFVAQGGGTLMEYDTELDGVVDYSIYFENDTGVKIDDILFV